MKVLGGPLRGVSRASRKERLRAEKHRSRSNARDSSPATLDVCRVDHQGVFTRTVRRAYIEPDLYGSLTGPLAAPLGSRLRRGSFTDRKTLNVDGESHERLARSSVPLPSDRDRTVRRPSLTREDAFCDADTFKPRSVRVVRAGDLADSTELYRMGLLYDDGCVLPDAPVFDLNSIPRDEPVYSVRPAKRARRLAGKAPRHGGHQSSRPLHLDLSFSDLGNDDAIARYLNASSASTPAEVVAAHDEAIQHAASLRSSNGSPPLRVIYELDTMRPSFDVDTSQPPDLVDDASLDDYDCFSDSDLDLAEKEGPEREIREGPGGPADAWVVLD